MRQELRAHCVRT